MTKTAKAVEAAQENYAARVSAEKEARTALERTDTDDPKAWDKADAEHRRKLAAVRQAERTLRDAQNAHAQAQLDAAQKRLGELRVSWYGDGMEKRMQPLRDRAKEAIRLLSSVRDEVHAVAIDRLAAEHEMQNLAGQLGVRETGFELLDTFGILAKYINPVYRELRETPSRDASSHSRPDLSVLVHGAMGGLG